MTLLIYTTIGIYFNHIWGGVCGEARAPPPPRPFQQACRSRASRCRWWPSWWPAAGFLLRAGGLRHPWVSPCLGRGRLAVVLPAEARGVAVAPSQGAREVVCEVGCEVDCDGGEVGPCAKWRLTEHFSRDPHPCGRSLTGAHPVCCARRRRKNSRCHRHGSRALTRPHHARVREGRRGPAAQTAAAGRLQRSPRSGLVLFDVVRCCLVLLAVLYPKP